MAKASKEKGFHFFCRVAAGVVALALIFATAVPLLRGDDWWIRVFDFPRIQIAALIGLTLVGYMALRLCGRLRPWDYALVAVVGIGLVWQLIAIAPYTRFYPSEMARSRAKDDSNRISLLAFNVLADNREVEALRELVRDTNPDIILLSEPTRWWLEQLECLEDSHPYTIRQPQENDYGILLYSRLELVDPEVRFLIDPEVPSLRTKVRLRSGKLVTLYGVHPRPPGIQRADDENHGGPGEAEGKEEDAGERQDSVMRDAELLSVAREVRKLGDAPVIVAGDFNDVAWSYTTALFQRVGGLLDPRIGRGLFNTFDSRSRILRYPLDHSFATGHFLLSEMHRLPNIGSDHFPLLVVLDYDPEALAASNEPRPNAGDAEDVDEAIIEGQTDN